MSTARSRIREQDLMNQDPILIARLTIYASGSPKAKRLHRSDLDRCCENHRHPLPRRRPDAQTRRQCTTPVIGAPTPTATILQLDNIYTTRRLWWDQGWTTYRPWSHRSSCSRQWADPWRKPVAVEKLPVPRPPPITPPQSTRSWGSGGPPWPRARPRTRVR
jgi:hypothetical protein